MNVFEGHSHFYIVAAVITAVLSIARTARLLCWDDYPPWRWVKVRLIAAMGDDWGQLFQCQFCLAPYLAAGMGVWMVLSDLNTFWWVVNLWWGASYVAAIVVSYDQSE